jgi:hypothetical protein
MLQIENRQQLLEDGELLPLVEQLVACFTEGLPISGIYRGVRCLGSTPGWIVFQDSRNGGFAVNVEGLVRSRTNLRLRVNSLHHARRIIERFGGREGFPLKLTDRLQCPAEWTLYQVSLRGGSILCGMSSPPPLLSHGVMIKEERVLRVNTSFVGYLPVEGLVSVGEAWMLGSLLVECPDQRFRGRLFISQEGAMSIQRDAMSETGDDLGVAGGTTAGALMRLDLGEIELSLHEVAALRSGSRIELKAELPLRCFMRVGTTTLAQGELQVDGEELSLRITEVMG